jgi:peptidoglycan/LPS O-acetylase OafA/YrhL
MGHLKALDGYRGLAVLLVMWSHFIAVSPGWGESAGPLARVLGAGHHGVDMFFVLSGFLITGILLDAKGRAGYFKVFIMRRVLRIFPLYYFVLAVTYGGTWLVQRGGADPFAETDPAAWFWLYASNWGMVVKGWGTPDGAWLITPGWVSLGHFWSLAVEEQFYLVWPWVVVWLDRRWLARLCVAFLFLAPVLQSLLADLAGNTLSGYVSTFGRLNTLGTGALLAIACRSPDVWARLQHHAGRIFALSGLALLAVLGGNCNWSLWKFDMLSALIPLCFGSGLVHALSPGGGRWQALLGSRVMRRCGTYSYGLYVYHHLLKPVWVKLFWDGWITPWCGTGSVAVACYILAAGTASMGLAYLSWTVLENPCLRLKRWFTYPDQKAAPSPAPAVP